MSKQPKEEEKQEESPEVIEIKDELNDKKAIHILASSEGGKILLKAFAQDIISDIETMTAKVSEMNLQQFIAITCRIKERLDIVRVLTKAKKNKEILEDLLKEQLINDQQQ